MRRARSILWLLVPALACASPDGAPPGDTRQPGPSDAAASETAPGQSDAPAPPGEAPATAVPTPDTVLPDPSPLSEPERELGRTFQPLADQFGLSVYANASRTASGRGLVFEYLPEGQARDDWEYRGIFVLTRVGDSWEQGLEVMPRFIEAFARQQGQVNEAGTWTFSEGDVTFLDYEGSTAGMHEHGLAAIWQVLPGHIAIFQAQRRPHRFEEWQITHFKQVASRLGRADADADGSAPDDAR